MSKINKKKLLSLGLLTLGVAGVTLSTSASAPAVNNQNQPISSRSATTSFTLLSTHSTNEDVVNIVNFRNMLYNIAANLSYSTIDSSIVILSRMNRDAEFLLSDSKIAQYKINDTTPEFATEIDSLKDLLDQTIDTAQQIFYIYQMYGYLQDPDFGSTINGVFPGTKCDDYYDEYNPGFLGTGSTFLHGYTNYEVDFNFWKIENHPDKLRTKYGDITPANWNFKILFEGLEPVELLADGSYDITADKLINFLSGSNTNPQQKIQNIIEKFNNVINDFEINSNNINPSKYGILKDKTLEIIPQIKSDKIFFEILKNKINLMMVEYFSNILFDSYQYSEDDRYGNIHDIKNTPVRYNMNFGAKLSDLFNTDASLDSSYNETLIKRDVKTSLKFMNSSEYLKLMNFYKTLKNDFNTYINTIVTQSQADAKYQRGLEKRFKDAFVSDPNSEIGKESNNTVFKFNNQLYQNGFMLQNAIDSEGNYNIIKLMAESSGIANTPEVGTRYWPRTFRLYDETSGWNTVTEEHYLNHYGYHNIPIYKYYFDSSSQTKLANSELIKMKFSSIIKDQVNYILQRGDSFERIYSSKLQTPFTLVNNTKLDTFAFDKNYLKYNDFGWLGIITGKYNNFYYTHGSPFTSHIQYYSLFYDEFIKIAKDVYKPLNKTSIEQLKQRLQSFSEKYRKYAGMIAQNWGSHFNNIHNMSRSAGQHVIYETKVDPYENFLDLFTEVINEQVRKPKIYEWINAIAQDALVDNNKFLYSPILNNFEDSIVDDQKQKIIEPDEIVRLKQFYNPMRGNFSYQVQTLPSNSRYARKPLLPNNFKYKWFDENILSSYDVQGAANYNAKLLQYEKILKLFKNNYYGNDSIEAMQDYAYNNNIIGNGSLINSAKINLTNNFLDDITINRQAELFKLIPGLTAHERIGLPGNIDELIESVFAIRPELPYIEESKKILEYIENVPKIPVQQNIDVLDSLVEQLNVQLSKIINSPQKNTIVTQKNTLVTTIVQLKEQKIANDIYSNAKDFVEKAESINNKHNDTRFIEDIEAQITLARAEVAKVKDTSKLSELTLRLNQLDAVIVAKKAIKVAVDLPQETNAVQLKQQVQAAQIELDKVPVGFQKTELQKILNNLNSIATQRQIDEGDRLVLNTLPATKLIIDLDKKPTLINRDNIKVTTIDGNLLPEGVTPTYEFNADDESGILKVILTLTKGTQKLVKPEEQFQLKTNANYQDAQDLLIISKLIVSVDVIDKAMIPSDVLDANLTTKLANGEQLPNGIVVKYHKTPNNQNGTIDIIVTLERGNVTSKKPSQRVTGLWTPQDQINAADLEILENINPFINADRKLFASDVNENNTSVFNNTDGVLLPEGVTVSLNFTPNDDAATLEVIPTLYKGEVKLIKQTQHLSGFRTIGNFIDSVQENAKIIVTNLKQLPSKLKITEAIVVDNRTGKPFDSSINQVIQIVSIDDEHGTATIKTNFNKGSQNGTITQTITGFFTTAQQAQIDADDLALLNKDIRVETDLNRLPSTVKVNELKVTDVDGYRLNDSITKDITIISANNDTGDLEIEVKLTKGNQSVTKPIITLHLKTTADSTQDEIIDNELEILAQQLAMTVENKNRLSSKVQSSQVLLKRLDGKTIDTNVVIAKELTHDDKNGNLSVALTLTKAGRVYRTDAELIHGFKTEADIYKEQHIAQDVADAINVSISVPAEKLNNLASEVKESDLIITDLQGNQIDAKYTKIINLKADNESKKLIVNLTLKDSEIISIKDPTEILGFKSQNELDKAELDALNIVAIVSNKNQKASEVLNNQIIVSNSDGSTISTRFEYNFNKNAEDSSGTLTVIVAINKGSQTRNIQIPITGFLTTQQANDVQKQQELESLLEGAIVSVKDKTKLPSQITQDDVIVLDKDGNTLPTDVTKAITLKSNDTAGTLVVGINISKDGIQENKNFPITGLKTLTEQSKEDENLLDSIQITASTTSEKLPTELSVSDINIKATNGKDLPEGVIPVITLSEPNDKLGTIKVKVTLTKGSQESVKETVVVKTKNSTTKTELNSLLDGAPVETKSEAKDKLPSDLTKEDIIVKDKDGAIIDPSIIKDIKITPNDEDGTATVTVTVEKDGIELTKDIPLIGQKTKAQDDLDKLAQGLQISVKPEAINKLPSQLDKDKDLIILDKLNQELPANITKLITLNPDDKNGVADVQVVLTNSDGLTSKVNKKLTGLKTQVLTPEQQANKEIVNKTQISIEIVDKNKLPSDVNKAEVVVKLADGNPLPSDISTAVELIPNNENGRLTIVTTLQKGDQSSPKEPIIIDGFKKDYSKYLNELAKNIQAILNENSKEKLPSELENNNIAIKDKLGVDLPSDVNIQYNINQKNDKDGNANVHVVLEKDGTKVTVDLALNNLTTIDEKYLDELLNGVSAEVKPESKDKLPNDLTKDDIIIKDKNGNPISKDILKDITVTPNDKNGTAIINITVTKNEKSKSKDIKIDNIKTQTQDDVEKTKAIIKEESKNKDSKDLNVNDIEFKDKDGNPIDNKDIKDVEIIQPKDPKDSVKVNVIITKDGKDYPVTVDIEQQNNLSKTPNPLIISIITVSSLLLIVGIGLIILLAKKW